MSFPIGIGFWRGQGGIPPFNQNLLFHYDFSDSSTLTTDAFGINAVTDKTGNGYNLSQSVNASKPQLISAGQNGLDVARFDGSNDWLEHQLTGTIDQWPMTIFIVNNLINGSNNGYGFSIGEKNEAAGLYNTLGTRQNPPVDQVIRRRSGSEVVQSASSANVFKCLCGVVNDGGIIIDLFVNNIFKGTVSQFRLNSALDLILLGRLRLIQSPLFWNGEIGEIKVYSDELSLAQINSVFNQLMTKWDL